MKHFFSYDDFFQLWHHLLVKVGHFSRARTGLLHSISREFQLNAAVWEHPLSLFALKN